MMLPAFPMVKNENSMGPITVACISVLANALKRKGDCQWDEALPDKMKKWNLIVGKETYDDMRLNMIVVGDAGAGKTALLKGISNLSTYRVEFRQSTPNYDQMIGSTEKWMEANQWKYQVFPGELSSDVLIMDEVLSVYLNDAPENKRIRELLRASLSRIGTNMIRKPQVRVPAEFQVCYYPECTLIQGFQPRKVPISLITEGDLRRAQIITIDFPLKEKEATRRFGSTTPLDSIDFTGDAKYKTAKEYLKYLRNKSFSIWVPDTVTDFVKDCMKKLREFTASYGAKASWFYKIAYFDLESQLLRYSIVMSVIRDSERPVIDLSLEDVKKAFPIFATAYADSIVWITRYTVGDYVLSPMKDKDLDRVLILIKWLKSKGAFTSRETETTVNQFKQFMVDKGWFSSEAGAKRFYQNLLGIGHINSAKKSGEWRVWIGKSGADLLEEIEGVDLPW